MKGEGDSGLLMISLFFPPIILGEQLEDITPRLVHEVFHFVILGDPPCITSAPSAASKERTFH